MINFWNHPWARWYLTEKKSQIQKSKTPCEFLMYWDKKWKVELWLLILCLLTKILGGIGKMKQNTLK